MFHRGEFLIIFKPFSRANFTALWTGQFLSRLGDVIFNVLLPLIIYRNTNSLNYIGVVMGALIIPQIVLLPFSGMLIDRISRKLIMILADFFRILLLCFLIFLNETSDFEINYIIICVILFGAMDALFKPAYAAVRAEVHTDEIRNSANSLTQIGFQIISFVGPALAGLLYNSISISILFVIDAFTFLISAVSIMWLKLGTKPKRKYKLQWSIKGFAREYKEGLNIIFNNSWLYSTILIFSLVNIAYAGIYKVLVPWFVEEHLLLNSLSYGIIISFSGGGGILTAIFFGMNNKIKKRGKLAYLGVLITGISLFCFSIVDYFPLLCVLAAISGSGVMLFGLIWENSLQEIVPLDDYGKVASIDMLGSITLLPIGYIFSAWLANIFNGVISIMSQALMIVVCALIMLNTKSVKQYQ